MDLKSLTKMPKNKSGMINLFLAWHKEDNVCAAGLVFLVYRIDKHCKPVIEFVGLCLYFPLP